jgi:PAS domain-containing protein
MAAPQLLTQIFEALPAPTFLVDDDVVVQLANRAGRALAALPEGALVPLERGGELLNCVHSEEHPDGCGRAEACRTCVVRGAVASALTIGEVAREQTTFDLRDPATGAVRSLTVLISAAPVDIEEARLAVLTIEDVSELVRLRGRDPVSDDEPVGLAASGLVQLGGPEGAAHDV